MYPWDVASLFKVERACSKCEKVKWSICVRNFLLIIALVLCISPSAGMSVVFRSGYCWASQVHTPTRSLWNAHCNMLVDRILNIKQIFISLSDGRWRRSLRSVCLLLVIWGAQQPFACCQDLVLKKTPSFEKPMPYLDLVNWKPWTLLVFTEAYQKRCFVTKYADIATCKLIININCQM
jgi:hypothetical protein